MNLYFTLHEEYERIRNEVLDEIEGGGKPKDITKAEGKFEGIQLLWEVLEPYLRELGDV